MDKPNKSKSVREYMKANPTATANEVADACGTSAQYVHQIKHQMKKRAEKPPRTYRKTTVVKKVEPTIVKVKRPAKEVPLLSNTDISNLIEQMVDMENKIESLEDNVIGYKAVIDFLEFQLGLRRGDNRGATV